MKLLSTLKIFHYKKYVVATKVRRQNKYTLLHFDTKVSD